MTPTFFGMIIALIGGVLLFRGGVLSMFTLLLYSTLFGGSAALLVTALGRVSIPPANFALIFLVLRLILPGRGQMGQLAAGVRANAPMVGFAAYGLIGAFFLSRIFDGALYVTPMQPSPGHSLFSVEPAHFSTQNITTSLYIVGTMLAGIGAYIAGKAEGAEIRLVKAGIVIALLHAFLGISGLLLENTPWGSFLELFRNGNYAQLDQAFEGIARMNGIWPEPSGYAGYGVAWFILMMELWLRDVLPGKTGLAALLLGLALFLSTSSTAYAGIGGYGLIVFVRSVFAPQLMPFRKVLALGVFSLLIGLFVIALMLFNEQVAQTLGRILASLTVNKGESASGIQRAFWAKQGLEAFVVSYGLGIGPGTFRSSSVLTAIIGGLGVVGTTAFIVHLIRVLRPLSAATYQAKGMSRETVGVAAGWTGFAMLIPASLASSSPDPGLLWGIFCGISLALRARPARVAANRSNASMRRSNVTSY